MLFRLAGALLLATSLARGEIRFQDLAAPAGLEFTLENAPTAAKHLPETMAGGVAAFDYDGDGLVDIFFTNGAAMPSLVKEGARYRNRLFKNLGNWRFRDVTNEAGLAGAGYSMAASAADFDNDGHADLFVAGVRHNILYRNRGNGTFEDVTATAGIGSAEWSVGGAWFDFDGDGLLDLFVVNYVEWTPAFDQFCGDAARHIRVYCHPKLFKGSANRLYRNLGHGRFADVSVESGIAAHIGKGMAAAVADYDGDGLPDLVVTNDKRPNFLFHNLGHGRFEEVAFAAGVALVDTGTEMSAMGADFRDVDNNGLPDIAATALAGETFPLFRNLGKGSFADAGFASKLGVLSRLFSGWGIGLYDFDNDGWKDIFTANSHVSDRVEAFEATAYLQNNTVFRNKGDGRFEDASKFSGQTPRAHRGCAFADFDRDGRIDVVTSSLGAGPELWANQSTPDHTWLVLKLTGVKSNRDAIGAVIRIGDQTNHVTTSVGYASSSQLGVHFGLAQRQEVEQMEIRWPSGVRQTLRNVKANQILPVTER